MSCPCTETDAKHFANSVTETYTDISFTFAKCFPNECLNVGCDLLKHLQMFIQMILLVEILELTKICLVMKR